MKFSAISTLAFVTMASAWTTVTVTAPPPHQTPPPASQCNPSGLSCCNSSNLLQANDPTLAIIWSLLGIVVEPITALVGINCASLALGGTCSQQPVCCQNNDFRGLVVIGCSPVSL